MKVQIFLSTNDGTIFVFVIQKSPSTEGLRKCCRLFFIFFADAIKQIVYFQSKLRRRIGCEGCICLSACCFRRADAQAVFRGGIIGIGRIVKSAISARQKQPAVSVRALQK